MTAWNADRQRAVLLSLIIATAIVVWLFVEGRPPSQWLLGTFAPVTACSPGFDTRRYRVADWALPQPRGKPEPGGLPEGMEELGTRALGGIKWAPYARR